MYVCMYVCWPHRVLVAARGIFLPCGARASTSHLLLISTAVTWKSQLLSWNTQPCTADYTSILCLPSHGPCLFPPWGIGDPSARQGSPHSWANPGVPSFQPQSQSGPASTLTMPDVLTSKSCLPYQERQGLGPLHCCFFMACLDV